VSFSLPVSPAANTVQSQIPAYLAAIQTSTTVLTAYTQDDLFLASPPASLATNIFEGPVTLDQRFLGIHAKAADAYKFGGGWNRSHDMGPRWSQWNPSSGVFDFTSMLAWLQACKAAGQETVVTIFDTPTWASARPGEGNSQYGTPGGKAEPANMANLSTAITNLMTVCGLLIDYLEVWNEPQTAGSTYYTGTAAKLAEMARTINQAAKAVKPSVKIMGVACTGINNNTAGFGIDYSNSFLTASDAAAGTGKLWIDILSVHTYEHSGTNKLSNLTVVKGYIDTLKTNNSITSMPVWSTEFGYITPAFDTYTGPSVSRAQALLRFALYNVAMGMARCSLYPYLNTDVSTEPGIVAEWNRFRNLLGGAVVQRINRLGNGDQLACVINGQNYLI